THSKMKSEVGGMNADSALNRSSFRLLTPDFTPLICRPDYYQCEVVRVRVLLRRAPHVFRRDAADFAQKSPWVIEAELMDFRADHECRHLRVGFKFKDETAGQVSLRGFDLLCGRRRGSH